MKNGLKYVSSLRESVSFIWERRVLSEKHSCFVWAVGVWSGGLLFSCTEGGKPLKHSYPRREFDQLLFLGHPWDPLSSGRSKMQQVILLDTVFWNRDLHFLELKCYFILKFLFIYFLNEKKWLFFFFFLAVLGLHCRTWTFSSYGERGLSVRCMGFALGWLLLLQSTSSRTQAQ